MHSIDLQSIPKEILQILLQDHTTNRNIIWAINDYADFGITAKSQILMEQITGENPKVIVQSRSQKKKELQSNRTKQKAEVFTPAWVCNAQNNLIDGAWFDRENVFNIEENKTWHTTKDKIIFDKNLESKKTWQDYVEATRLEITCGEAPYLTSRYDATTGEEILLEDRIGLLDRKLRVVNENVKNESEYFTWTKVAFQNIYGFEFCGDSLLIARINHLLSFIENTEYYLKRKPTIPELTEIAQIISWNLWQMDGLIYKTPFSSKKDTQPSLFEENSEVEDFPCKIMDWKEDTVIEFRSLLKDKKDGDK